GDEQVRHLRQVVDQRPALGVFAEKERHLQLGGTLARQEEDFLEPDHGAVLIGNLDADRVLAWNRRNDADTRHFEIQSQVTGERRYRVDAQTGFEGHFV